MRFTGTMKKSLLLLVLACLIVPLQATAGVTHTPHHSSQSQPDLLIKDVYKKAKLQGVMDYKVFKEGYTAYFNTKGRKKQLLTIIDYSKPSTQKRFYVIDLKRNKLVYYTYVTHGVNSGGKVATKFSNIVNSRQTSLGTFLTDNTYYGGNGYSLRLDGLTHGVNDNARRRYIVVHGAKYAEESFIRRNGYLGRSWGCPALPTHLARQIIDTIKNGSVIYARA